MRNLVMALLVVSQMAAHADDRLLLYGTEISPESAYLYLGTIVPIKQDDDMYFIRLWTDMQAYEYEKGIETIDADSRSMQLAFGKQFVHENGWVNIYLGYAISNTELEPDDPDNESAGRHKQGVVSFDGEYDPGQCDYNLIYGASYLFDQEAYWARVRPICWSYKDAGLGFELVNHGDHSYTHTQLGAVLYNKPMSASTRYTLKGGLTYTRDSDVFPYIGIEFTTLY